MEQEGFNFDLAEGERLRDAGVQQAADMMGRRFQLEKAREVAAHHAHSHGEVTYDNVYLEMQVLGYRPELLGKAAAAVFSGPEWEPTGEWRRSGRVTNHARAIRVWRLRGAA